MTLLRRIGLFAVAVIVLIVLSIWSLPWTIPLVLAIAGVDDVTFDDLAVGFRSARLDGLAIGDRQQQRVATIEARYSLGGLLSGRLQQFRIDGLEVDAVYGDGVLDFGEEIAAAEDGQPDEIAFEPTLPIMIDELLIENSRIGVETSFGMLDVPFEGRASVVDDRVEFDLGMSSAELTAEDQGTLCIGFELSGSLPITGEPRADQVTARGRIDMQAADVDLIRRGQPVSATSVIDLNLVDGRFSLAGPLEASGRFGSVTGNLAATVELDDQLKPVAIASGDAAFDLNGIHLEDGALDRGRIALEIGGPLEGLRGSLDIDLDGLTASLGRIEVLGIKMQRVFDIALTDQAFEVIAGAEGKKTSIDQVRITDGDEILLESGWFTLQWPGREEPWLRFDLDDRNVMLDWPLEIDPVRLDLVDRRFWARIEDLALTLDGSPEGLESGAIRIRRGRIDLPSANLALVGIESDIPLSGSGLSTDRRIPLAVRLVRPLDQPRLFTPFRLDARIGAEPSTVDIEGRLTTKSDPAAVLAIEGQHDIETGQGTADIDLAPIAFAAGSLQPANLSPILDGVIDEAEGGLALNGRIGWRDGELSSDLALLIDELGFSIGPARLSRINSVIRFDGISPLTTEGDQLLSVGLLDVGLPLTDGLVSMRLRPDGQLAVDRLTWRLADGEIRAAPFTFGSDVQDLTLMLTAEQLDLNELLRLTPLDELTGEGRIDGTLPLTIGEAAAIDGGELVATGEGVLRYKPSTVPGVLQAGGESVRLMLQALENFQYDALKITIDGRTDGANAVGLHLKGSNPELYDGHPVEFNLNLEGSLASLVQANIDNYQIPDRIRERLQGFER